MRSTELEFDRPEVLQAVAPPETGSRRRDSGRLLVSTPQGHVHAEFKDLPLFLSSGDLLVVNKSATIPASLPALGPQGLFIINLCTRYGDDLWLVEPRWNPAEPGPIGLKLGDPIEVAGIPARLIQQFPGIKRLWFVRFESPIEPILEQHGKPIHYGYISEQYPLDDYQTLFSRVPGSVEMPSAARPFTPTVVQKMQEAGAVITSVVLHTGVSSLEVETEEVEDQLLFPEPFEVSESTTRLVNQTHERGGRVIAVGTSVARALETVWDGAKVSAASGFTRLFIYPERGVHAFEGLLTGFHDPMTSHLALLYAVAGRTHIQEAYFEAIRAGYLWHEFGDSHLILR